MNSFHTALSQIKRTRERGRGMAIAALVVGYILLGVLLLSIAYAIFVSAAILNAA